MQPILRTAFLALACLAAPALPAAEDLQVMQRSPVGDLQSLDAADAVLVTFSHPMVALSSGEDMGAFCPIQVTPALPGRCRWRGTNTLAYEFTQAPGPGQSFHVRIPAGTASKVGGQALAQDVEFGFTTLRPAVESLQPQADQVGPLGREPRFFLQFNVSVSAQAAPAYIELKGRPHGGGIEQKVPLTVTETSVKALRQRMRKGELRNVWFYGYGKSEQVLELVPAKPLASDAHYRLRVAQGLPALGGGEGGGLAEDYVSEYDTYAPLQVLAVEGPDAQCDGPHPYLRLSNQVALGELAKSMSVSPPVKAPALSEAEAREDGYRTDSGARLQLDAWKFKPGVEYSFTFDAGLQDVFGQALGKAQTLRWKAPAYCPQVEVRSGFGVLESYGTLRHPLETLNAGSVLVKAKQLSPAEAVPYLAQRERASIETALADVAPKTLTLPASVDAGRRGFVDLRALLGGYPLGVVLLAVKGGERWSTAVDNITGLGLTVKSSPASTLLWTSSLRDGTAVGYVAVELRLADGKKVWSGRTDKDGLAHAPGWRELGIQRWNRYEQPELFAAALHASGAAVLSSRYDSGIEPWRFGMGYDRVDSSPPMERRKFFVFSDRGVYKPGESVHFKGLIRDFAGQDWAEGTALKSVALTLKDSRDKAALSATAQVGPGGGFDLAFDLPASAATGWWTLRGGDGEDEDYSSDKPRREGAGFSFAFRVEAVKTAGYEVRLGGLKSWDLAGALLAPTVDGRYHSGTPLAGSAGTWALNLQPVTFQPKGWEGFDFTPLGGDDDEEDQARRPRSGGSGSLKLDRAGRAALSLPTEAAKGCTPCDARLEVGLESPDRQRLFTRASVLLHQGLAYPGLKPGKMGSVGKAWSAKVVVADPDGLTLPASSVKLRLRREDVKSSRKVGVAGRLEWISQSQLVDVSTQVLSTGAGPTEWSFVPAQPGRYRLRAEASDAKGRANHCEIGFYIYGDGEAAWRQDDSEAVELVPDQPDYAPGDSAKILVKSPFAKATALITVEREGVIDAQVRELGQAGAVEIALGDRHVPNVFVGVVLIQGRAKAWTYGPDGEDLAKPRAKFGYVELKVRPSGRRLQVAVAPGAPEFRPGATATAKVSVRRADGKPSAGEVTLYAVDEGMLQLTGYQTPDPFASFYGPRPLWVSTADNRLAVIGMRSFGEKGQDRGGGGGEPGAEGADLRRDFRPLAFWAATLPLGRDGSVSASFKLPDNLTKFRLMAVAHEGVRFGSGEGSFRVNKLLSLRPSLPRFARVGDAFEGGVLLQNASDKDAVAEVELELGGPLSLSGPSKVRVPVAAGASVEQRWRLQAVGRGEAVLRVRALAQLGGPERDALEWRLPVTASEQPQHAATSGVLDKERTEEAVALPADALPGSASLRADLGSSAMGGLRGGVEYLLGYPHGCLEQRLSKALPVVAGADLLEAFHLGPLPSKKKAAQAVLDELPLFQAGSGGYRYWSDGWLKADPWLTCYALETAALAKANGFKVPKASLKQAADWLRGALDKPQDWAYGYGREERDCLKAYAVYVLSSYGGSLPGVFQELYQRRGGLPQVALADLLRASRSLNQGAAAKDLAQALLNQAKVDARGLHFEEPQAARMPWVHASTVAVTAHSLDALLDAQGGFSGDDKAAAWLAQARRPDGAWDNTQSNAWALMALSRYFKRYEKEAPDFKAQVLAMPGDQALLSAEFRGRSLAQRSKDLDPAALWGASTTAQLSLTRQGSGRLYYALVLGWVPRLAERALEEGFKLERRLSGFDGKPVSGPLKAGERYLVTLKVQTKQDRSFVALSDPLPGGLELVDTTLASESKLPGLAPELQPSAASHSEAWWGGFQRQEAYDDRVSVYADFLEAGTHEWRYVVQATTPGRFAQPAASVEQMYQPENYGRSAGRVLDVR